MNNYLEVFIKDKIKDLILMAETIFKEKGSGTTKLDYVIRNAKIVLAYLKELGVDIDSEEFVNFLTQEIEKLVDKIFKKI